MLQKCLPQQLQNYEDIIFHDGPILSIIKNGGDFYVYYLVDLKYDLDENPYRYSFILLKIKDEVTRDKLIAFYKKNYNDLFLYDGQFLEDLLLDTDLKVSYGVNYLMDTIEWYDLREYGVEAFLKTYAEYAWKSLNTIRREG